MKPALESAWNSVPKGVQDVIAAGKHGGGDMNGVGQPQRRVSPQGGRGLDYDRRHLMDGQPIGGFGELKILLRQKLISSAIRLHEQL